MYSIPLLLPSIFSKKYFFLICYSGIILALKIDLSEIKIFKEHICLPMFTLIYTRNVYLQRIHIHVFIMCVHISI